MRDNDFKPKNLDEAVDYILSHISSSCKSIEMLEAYSDDERGFGVQLHFFFGMNIRNTWNLWWYEGHGYKNMAKRQA